MTARHLQAVADAAALRRRFLAWLLPRVLCCLGTLYAFALLLWAISGDPQ